MSTDRAGGAVNEVDGTLVKLALLTDAVHI
jgi:hypothetical protein